MFNRHQSVDFKELLCEAPVLAILGPRQVGKTTLARQIASEIAAASESSANESLKSPQPIIFDMESAADRAALADAEATFRAIGPRLVVIDEIQRVPGLFQALRVVVDERRRDGYRFGQFLVLGSASIELIQHASETLAGRIHFVELSPLVLTEIAQNAIANLAEVNQLWLRGGFPDAFQARSDAASLRWREQFISTYLERDIAFFAPRLPAQMLRRFWTLTAHLQGTEFNAAHYARTLEFSAQTATRYLDLLTDMYLLRRVPAEIANVGKRLRKAPRVFVRDCGLVHALLGIGDIKALLSHPVQGASWEGFVIEQLLAAAPKGATYSYYRTQSGAEIDLIITHADRKFAFEIKRSAITPAARGFHEACADLGIARRYLIHGGDKFFVAANGVQAMSVTQLTCFQPGD